MKKDTKISLRFIIFHSINKHKKKAFGLRLNKLKKEFSRISVNIENSVNSIIYLGII
jgi:hypothetical protein